LVLPAQMTALGPLKTRAKPMTPPTAAADIKNTGRCQSRVQTRLRQTDGDTLCPVEGIKARYAHAVDMQYSAGDMEGEAAGIGWSMPCTPSRRAVRGHYNIIKA
jgi:hypothetical protein